jgi:RimJ/RimL family protein N-acetyltransferase
LLDIGVKEDAPSAARERGEPRERRGFCAPSLRSAEARLRGWRRADAPALAAVCGDPLICAYTTIPERYSEVTASKWIERQIRALRDGTALVLAIETAGGARPVGAVWLFGFDALRPRTARVGGWLRVESRGQGLMTAAIRMLAGWAFSELELEALEMCFEPDNVASRRVTEKLGAARSGWVRGARSRTPTILEHHTLRPPAAAG